MKDNEEYIYGVHPVREALLNAPRALEEIFIEGESHQGLRTLALEKRVAVRSFESEKLPHDIRESSSHQGVVALFSYKKLMQDFDDFLLTLEVTPHTSLVLLGEVQDPHNVGAVIRSAAAFGASGVLIPEHRQAPVTGTVVKVSAGMAFHVPLVAIGNVNTTIRDLKEKGFWIYGLSGEGDHAVTTEVFDAPAVFILGNEGKGIREKTLEHCDIALQIPMHPRAESLNASVSAAVVLHEWSKQHPQALVNGENKIK